MPLKARRCIACARELFCRIPNNRAMRNFIRVLSVTAAATAALACAVRPAAHESSTPELRSEVQAVLDHGARTWTHGELDAFMSDYMPGERTTYVTSKGLIHGPAAIRER